MYKEVHLIQVRTFSDFRAKIIMLLKLLADNVPGMSLLMRKFYISVSVKLHPTPTDQVDGLLNKALSFLLLFSY